MVLKTVNPLYLLDLQCISVVGWMFVGDFKNLIRVIGNDVYGSIRSPYGFTNPAHILQNYLFVQYPALFQVEQADIARFEIGNKEVVLPIREEGVLIEVQTAYSGRGCPVINRLLHAGADFLW